MLIWIWDKIVLALVEVWLWRGYYRLALRSRRINQSTPCLANPQNYVEMMLWRKTVDRNPLLVTFGDKLLTKEYFAERCPDLKFSRVLWKGQNEQDIPLELFETADTWFKANHGSSYNLLCLKGKPSYETMKTKHEEWARMKFGIRSGEWNYRLVKPQVFLEESIKLPGIPLIEFQIRAADGVPLVGSYSGLVKTSSQWCYYLDPSGQLLSDVIFLDKDDSRDEVIPIEVVMDQYLKAVELSAKLSRGCDYIRCDFFWNGENLYGSEMTVFPNGGDRKQTLKAVDLPVVTGWDLRKSHFLSTPQKGWRKWYAASLRRTLDRRAAIS